MTFVADGMFVADGLALTYENVWYRSFCTRRATSVLARCIFFFAYLTSVLFTRSSISVLVLVQKYFCASWTSQVPLPRGLAAFAFVLCYCTLYIIFYCNFTNFTTVLQVQLPRDLADFAFVTSVLSTYFTAVTLPTLLLYYLRALLLYSRCNCLVVSLTAFTRY
jgi:hypothetical protein